MLGPLARRYGLRPTVASLRAQAQGTPMQRSLGWVQLTALGVGAIVGAGVFSVVGIAAAQYSGPAVVVSFVIAAFVALLAALAYAELAAMLPLGGSAYTYATVAGGELFGWLVGWALLLSYGIGNAAVASSFSDNLTGLLQTATGWAVPGSLASAPADGGLADLPGAAAVLLVTLLLLRPVRESARANAVLVVLKVGILLVFLAAALPRGDAANLAPFAPFGAEKVFVGSALIFFAFLGFDAVSTAAEETRDPQRDLPRGILGSIAVVTLLFIAIGFALTALVPLAVLDNGEPLAAALRAAGLPGLSAVMNVGALVASVTVLLVFQLATVRICLALARDGLVPPGLARLSERHGTPNRLTLLAGAVVAVSTALVPLGLLVQLTNLATLFIFGAAMLALLVLRRVAADAPRPFRCPWVPLVPGLGILACLALGVYTVIDNPVTGTGLLAWMGLGVMLYAWYGASHSRLRKETEAPPADSS